MVALTDGRTAPSFPEVSPSVSDAVDEMLVRLSAYAQRWGSADAAILSRKLVSDTVYGDAVTQRWLARAARFLA